MEGMQIEQHRQETGRERERGAGAYLETDDFICLRAASSPKQEPNKSGELSFGYPSSFSFHPSSSPGGPARCTP